MDNFVNLTFPNITQELYIQRLSSLILLKIQWNIQESISISIKLCKITAKSHKITKNYGKSHESS